MAKDESASFNRRGSVRQSVCLSDALELAKKCQISGAGYREIAREIAGPFWKQISAVFRGHYLAVYLLTDHNRRSVWHAVLSAGHDDGVHLRCDAIAQQEFLHRFLHNGSEVLITGAFGSCPAGYLSVLKRFPTKAERDASVFKQLHQLLTGYPHLGPQLCNHGRVSSRLVQLLTMLPPQLKHLRVAAEQFDGDARIFDGFMATYAALTGRLDLSPADVACLLRGEKPGSILQRIYHAIPFPAQFLPETDRVKHLHNGEAMVCAAVSYHNCLKSWLGEAHSSSQFYEIVLADGSTAILSLKKDAPAGWILDEVKLAGNVGPDDALQDELQVYLAKFGVRVGPPLEAMLRRFARPSLGETETDIFGLDADILEFLGDVD